MDDGLGDADFLMRRWSPSSWPRKSGLIALGNRRYD